MFTFQKIILFIALRYICRKTTDQFGQYIYWVATFSITLGVAVLIILLSVMNGFEQDLKKNILYFTPHVLLTNVKGYVHVKNVPNLMFDKLPNIEYIQPLVFSDIILQSATKILFGSMLGINPNYLNPLFNYFITHNCINQLVSGKYYIILGSALAHYLEVNINDQIRLIVPTVMQTTPIGRIPSQRLCTVLDIYMTNNKESVDNFQVLIHQSDAAKLMHYPSEDYITGWRLWLRDPFVINDTHQLSLSNEWLWKDWRNYKGSVFQAVQMEKNIMSLLLSLIIVAACFNIMSFLVLLIIEKKTEIAILQTYGFSRIHIISIFVIQGISNGIFGIIFGIGLGILLSKKLNQILSCFNFFSNTLQFPIEIEIYQIFIIAITTFIMVLLITLYPSWHIASSSPIKNLYYG